MLAEICIPDHLVIQFFTGIVIAAGTMIAGICAFVAWIARRLIVGMRKNNP